MPRSPCLEVLSGGGIGREFVRTHTERDVFFEWVLVRVWAPLGSKVSHFYGLELWVLTL